MRLSFKKMAISLFILSFVILMSIPASAEVMETNVNLNCKLTDGSARIPTTTDVDADTIATVDYQIYWETDTAPEDEIKSIKGYFYYKNDSAAIILEDEYTTPNWDGNIVVHVHTDTPDESYDKVELTFTDDTPSKLPQESPTSYVTLKFKITPCEEEGFSTALTLDAGTNGMQIDDGSDTWYYAGNRDPGELSVSSYFANFKVAGQTHTCGIMGDRITVYVLCDNNFRSRGMAQYITYDDNKLDYVANSWTLYNSGLWRGDSFCSESNDTLKIMLYAPTTTDMIPDFDTYPNDGDTLYSIQFDALSNPAWDGPANAATIDLIRDSSTAFVYYDDGMFKFCSALQEVWDYTDGTIQMADYDGEIKVDFDCEDCDPYITQSDGEATAVIKVEANFDFGGASDRIEAVIDLSNDWSSADFNTPYNGLTFEENSLDYTYIAIEQYNSVELDCTEGEYDSLGLVTVDFDDANFTPNYANRFVDLCPIDDYSTYESHVTDETGNVTIEYGDGLIFTCGEAEIIMGEFSTTSGSSNNTHVEHTLRVRNNFDIDTLAVTITVESGSGWCLNCIKDYNTSHYEYVTDGSGKKFRSKSAFNGISASDDDDDYTTLATLVWGVTESCTGSGSYSMTPELSSGMMKNSSGQSQYIAYVENSLLGYCNDGSGGCLTQPASCLSKPITKTEGENSELGENVLPLTFALHPNRPNPFNPQTVISYDVPVASHVSIQVINILGQHVTTLVDEQKAPGQYEAVWNGVDANGSRVSSGIYLYNMRAGDFTETKKMMLMK